MNKRQEAEIKRFVKERDEALFSMDEDRIRRYFKKRGLPIPEGDTLLFWAVVYKCICNITTAPPDLVANARAWLDEHGFSAEIY